MEIFGQIIKLFLIMILGSVAVYIIARLVAYAAAKSWYQAKRNEEETQNGKEKEE